VDDIRFYLACAEPARQPEAITAGFKGHNDALDLAANFNCLVPPAIQQPKQSFWVGRKLLEWITRDTRNDRANQPLVEAQFNCSNDGAILIEGDEGSAEVIFQLRHEALHCF
jgi:hypothetical protein